MKFQNKSKINKFSPHYSQLAFLFVHNNYIIIKLASRSYVLVCLRSFITFYLLVFPLNLFFLLSFFLIFRSGADESPKKSIGQQSEGILCSLLMCDHFASTRHLTHTHITFLYGNLSEHYRLNCEFFFRSFYVDAVRIHFYVRTNVDDAIMQLTSIM